MKRLFSYMNQKRKEAILAPLLKMLEASFELIIPLIVADMIDRGISQHDSHRILLSGGLMILLGLTGFSVSLIAQYFAAKCAVNTGTLIRSDLFRHITSLSYANIDQLGTSTLITRMTSDINQVQNGVNMFLRLLLRSPFVVLGAMVMAFTVDVRTACIFLVIIPVLLVIVFGILLGTRPLYKKVQTQLDTVTLKTRENLQGIRVVRAFNRQNREKEEFSKASGSLYKKQIYVGRISALLNPVTYVVINLGIIFILYKGGQQVNLGRLTQGQVIALVNYMSQILVELVKLANLIILLSKAAASMNRVDAVFCMEPAIQENDHPAIGLNSDDQIPYLEFKDVSFSYGASGVPAIHDISFVIHQGETVGVIGGTGSGKSSLINLIPRLYDCASGEILFNGINIKEEILDVARGRVGLVPQLAQLFKGTLRSNLRMGCSDASDEEMFRALEIAQSKEFVDAKGCGLDLTVEQEGRNFSGGQKQRLTIARALVKNPEILILDDSASALDFATDARLRKAIKELDNDKTTVFLVSQRVSTVRESDRILVMDDGRIVGNGKHSVLLHTCPVYREICESQMSATEIKKDLQEGDIRNE